MGVSVSRPVVILADDDDAITSNLAPFLDRAGFTVHVAADGDAALELVERLDPDGCVLDVLMPGPDGREVLRRLRRAGRWLPVVLLTQVGESAERAIALDEGADDYLNKPFDPYELLARLRAVLRRDEGGVSQDQPRQVTIGQWLVDLTAHQVRRAPADDDGVGGSGAGGGDDERVTLRLTPTEWRILAILLDRPGQLVGSAQILTRVWGPGSQQRTNYLRVHMARLRRKLEDNPARPRHLLTEPGMGYRYQP